MLLPATSDRPLFGAPVALIDFETTWVEQEDVAHHLHPQHPVQVAVVHFELGLTEPRVVLERMVRPPFPILQAATDCHGITDDDVMDADGIAEVLPEIEAALSGRVLAAYNLPFDYGVLCQCIRRVRGSRAAVPAFGGIDPLTLARIVFKFEKGKRLGDVARRYGIVLRAHDATRDSIAAAKVLPLLIRDCVDNGLLDERDLDTVGSLYAALVRESVAWEAQLAKWHRRRHAPPPFAYWTELTGETP